MKKQDINPFKSSDPELDKRKSSRTTKDEYSLKSKNLARRTLGI